MVWIAASWTCFVPTLPERAYRPPRAATKKRYGAVMGLSRSACRIATLRGSGAGVWPVGAGGAAATAISPNTRNTDDAGCLAMAATSVGVAVAQPGHDGRRRRAHPRK